jgi:site-specific recombinase XerD
MNQEHSGLEGANVSNDVKALGFSHKALHKPTVDQMVAGWLHAKASLSHSEMTLDAYTDYMTAFRALLHQYGLDLDSEETVIAEYAQWWAEYSSLGHPISSSTHNQRIHTISSFYVYARKMRYLPTNPMEMVEKRKVSHPHAAMPLDVEAVKAALLSINRSTIIGKRDYALLVLLLNTGRRASEIRLMKCGDITIVGSTVMVTWQRCKGGKVMHDTLASQVALALIEYLKAAYGNEWRADAPVWLCYSNHGKGEPIGYRAIAGICEKYLGVTTVHTTRHSFALFMETAGAKLSDIGSRLGHNNLATTSEYMKRLHSSENVYAGKLVEILGMKEHSGNEE